MIRSRILTYGFRLWFGIAVYAFVAAIAFALGSGIGDDGGQGAIESGLGPLTLGWKGGVGSHIGYVVLVSSAFVAGFVAFVLIAFRDADPEAQASYLDVETVPMTKAPTGASLAPFVGALTAVGVIVGLVGEPRLFQASIIVAVMAALVWTVRAWANRATGDDATNDELYHRIIDPLRVPIAAAIIVAFVVVGLSRLLLAVDKVGSVVVFSVAATVFFLLAVLLATRPSVSKNVMTAVVVVGAIVVLAIAIGGVIAGERDFEHHGDEHGGEGEGALPVAPSAPVLVEVGP